MKVPSIFTPILCTFLITLILCFVSTTHGQQASPFTLSTVVNKGFMNNVQALDVSINAQSCVLTPEGDIILADPSSNTVSKILTNGTIILLAGTGSQGYSGDGGLATKAALNGPQSVALDSSGNIYIADTKNNVIRKVSNGVISTVAGTGNSGGISASGVLATQASLGGPVGVAVDSKGQVYFSEPENHAVRMVKNGVLTTVAGIPKKSTGYGDGSYNGDNILATSATLNNPSTIAIDSLDQVYITDANNYIIRKVLTNGTIVLVAGIPRSNCLSQDGGLAIESCISNPSGISVDSNGQVYITEPYNNRVLVILSNGTLKNFAGVKSATGGYSGDGDLATRATLNNPLGVGVHSPSGRVYITDNQNYAIRMVESSGLIKTVAGFGKSSDAMESYLNANIVSCTISSSGSLYFSNSYGVRQVMSDGSLKRIYFKSNIMTNTITTDSYGNLYIVDTYGYSILKVLTNGTVVTIAGGTRGSDGDGGLATLAKFDYATNVAVDSQGTGSSGYSGDGGLATQALVNFPTRIVLDSLGQVYFSDKNNVIRKISSDGTISTIAGTGEKGFSGDGGLATKATFNTIGGLAFDSQGQLFVSDTYNHVIRKISSSGIITTVFGNGTYGSTLDGLVPANSKLDNPSNAVVYQDKIYFVEGYMGKLRMLYQQVSFTCYGKTGSSVCNGQGNCIATDTCSCQNGYSGSECQQYSCFNTLSTNSKVCTGHGQCTGPNTCNCQSGWKGDAQCSTFSCDALNSCNGKGSCTSNNTCSCNLGWSSSDCSVACEIPDLFTNEIPIKYSIGEIHAIPFGIHIPACYVGKRVVSYSYTIDGSPTIVLDGLLVLGGNGYVLHEEGTFTFVLKAVLDGVITRSASIQIHAVAQPVSVSFSIPDMTQSQDVPVAFRVVRSDPSFTHDPDSLETTCRDEYGNVCKSPGSSPYFNTTFAPGIYTFTTIYVKGSRNATATVKVTVLSLHLNSIISLGIDINGANKNNLVPHKDMSLSFLTEDSLSKNVKFYWTCDSTSVKSQLPYYTIPKTVMIPGAKISVFLNVTDGSKVGLANIQLVVASLPIAGSFDISPPSGLSLQTPFTLNLGNGWSSQLSDKILTFEFFRLDDLGEWISIMSTSSVGSVSTILPAPLSGSVTSIKVVASDSVGSTMSAIANTTVKSLSVESTKIMVDSLAQSSSISPADASSALSAIGSITTATPDQMASLQKSASSIIDTITKNLDKQEQVSGGLTPEIISSTLQLATSVLGPLDSSMISTSSLATLIGKVESVSQGMLITSFLKNMKQSDIDSLQRFGGNVLNYLMSPKGNSRMERVASTKFRSISRVLANLYASTYMEDYGHVPNSAPTIYAPRKDVITIVNTVSKSLYLDSLTQDLGNNSNIQLSRISSLASLSFYQTISVLSQTYPPVYIPDAASQVITFGMKDRSGQDVLIDESSHIATINTNQLVRVEQRSITSSKDLVCNNVGPNGELSVATGCTITLSPNGTVSFSISTNGTYVLTTRSSQPEETSTRLNHGTISKISMSVLVGIFMVLLTVVGL